MIRQRYKYTCFRMVIFLRIELYEICGAIKNIVLHGNFYVHSE